MPEVRTSVDRVTWELVKFLRARYDVSVSRIVRDGLARKLAEWLRNAPDEDVKLAVEHVARKLSSGTAEEEWWKDVLERLLGDPELLEEYVRSCPKPRGKSWIVTWLDEHKEQG